MLVLTRKKGEGILIGDNIKIHIVEVKGGTVRIGLDAPREKKIYRQEIFERIQAENKGATEWKTTDLDAILAPTITTQKEEK